MSLEQTEGEFWLLMLLAEVLNRAQHTFVCICCAWNPNRYTVLDLDLLLAVGKRMGNISCIQLPSQETIWIKIWTVHVSAIFRNFRPESVWEENDWGDKSSAACNKQMARWVATEICVVIFVWAPDRFSDQHNWFARHSAVHIFLSLWIAVVLALISTCTAVFAWYWILDPETSKVRLVFLFNNYQPL